MVPSLYNPTILNKETKADFIKSCVFILTVNVVGWAALGLVFLTVAITAEHFNPAPPKQYHRCFTSEIAPN